MIASGSLVPGERLPGERQLAQMMNVSRVSVRAALQQLKAQGLVAATQGGSTRIIASSESLDRGLGRLVRADLRNLLDLAELRAQLEAWAARRAARLAFGADPCASTPRYTRAPCSTTSSGQRPWGGPCLAEIWEFFRFCFSENQRSYERKCEIFIELS